MNLFADSIEERIERILTQYRESPKLIHLLRTYLWQIEDVREHMEGMPLRFDLDTATGDQLTLIGKRLGWPRSHCVCDVQPVFGFECEGFASEYPIGGFCDESVTWEDCGAFGLGEITIADDDVYRKFLQVRRYQMTAQFDLASLQECVRIFWGDDAVVLDSGHGRVVICPGRDLTSVETALLQLYPRVLPVALGVAVRFHFDTPYVFGFGEGWGGFCEPWEENGLPLSDGVSNLVTEEGEEIFTGPLTRDAIWMCETDVNPYSCN